MKYYFIADLHIRPGDTELLQKLDKFLSELAHREPGSYVYFLGDVFQFFSPIVNISVFTYESVFRVLRQYSSSLRITLVEGNHEFFLNKWNGASGDGMEMKASPQVIQIGDRTIYLTHGDELAGGTFFNRCFRRFVKSRVIYSLFSLLPERWIWEFALFLSKMSRHKNSRPSTRLIQSMERRALRLLGKYDVVIAGHSHSPRVVERNGKYYINVGSFVDGSVLVGDGEKFFFTAGVVDG